MAGRRGTCSADVASSIRTKHRREAPRKLGEALAVGPAAAALGPVLGRPLRRTVRRGEQRRGGGGAESPPLLGRLSRLRIASYVSHLMHKPQVRRVFDRTPDE